MKQIALLTILTMACVDHDPPKIVEEPTVIAPKEPAGFAGPDGPQGEIGPHGVAGPRGELGPNGPQGERGETGRQGPQGEVGREGAQGEQGIPGRDGRNGERGPIGPRGGRGEMGLQGRVGLQGERGETGRQGPVGPQGERGRDGSRGEIGRQGPQGGIGLMGPQGPEGLIGTRGEVGPQGTIGLTGPQGERGGRGETGPQGTQGIQGETGPQGLQGSRGADGAPGQPGPRGERGERGEVGPQGSEGPQGEACDPTDDTDQDGFVDWVEMATDTNPYDPDDRPLDENFDGIPDVLVGAHGETGERGEQGIQGERGEVGPQGETGPVGLQGPHGAQGGQGLMGLTGPRGEPGPQGEIGLTGPMGQAGPQGERGLEGPQGPAWEPPTLSCPEGTEPIYYDERLVYCFKTISNDDGMNWLDCHNTCRSERLEMVDFEDLTGICLDRPELLSGSHFYWGKNITWVITYSFYPKNASSCTYNPYIISSPDSYTRCDEAPCGSFCENFLSGFNLTSDCAGAQRWWLNDTQTTNLPQGINTTSYTFGTGYTFEYSVERVGNCCCSDCGTCLHCSTEPIRTVEYCLGVGDECGYYHPDGGPIRYSVNTRLSNTGSTLLNFECMCGKKPE